MFVSDPTHASAAPGEVHAISSGLPAVPWMPDVGDGTYRNPVLHADYSDPDAIRVGADFWLTASSFSHVPGLPILHSTDLVNWSLVNHALPRLVPTEHFSMPRHGEGVWAPSIRHHAGRFWIFYPDPDFGLYVVTAADPRGRWSDPVMLKPGKGLIDPCPLWDDDGRAYLVHGWAKSRAGIKNRLTLHRMDPDGTRLLDEGVVVIDGDRMNGWHTIEGPKLYKRNGYYYIFAPAGGVGEGYQAVFRSRRIEGPYEDRIVLAQGGTPVNGPHQGAWVDTADGEHWFLHFQEVPAYGRVVHLQPVRWNDDWPAMGRAVPGQVAGEPVLRHRKPRTPTAAKQAAPATSDEFASTELGLQWQWQANPRADWFSLTSRPGHLRLNAVPARGDTLWSAPHLLMQKFAAAEFDVTTILDPAGLAPGGVSGLVVFGHSYAWLGVRAAKTGLRLVLACCDDAQRDGIEREVASAPLGAGPIVLRMSVRRDALCQFHYGTTDLQPLGAPFTARSSTWVGAKFGLFAGQPAGSAAVSYADFDYVRVSSPA